MINYITFDNNEDFRAWQEEHNHKINVISPVVSEINMDISEDTRGNLKTSDGTGKTNIGVFVVYFDEKND